MVDSNDVVNFIVSNFNNKFYLWKKELAGKPIILFPKINHNISKSNHYIFCCVSEEAIGIDIEEYSAFQMDVSKLINVIPKSIRLLESNSIINKEKTVFYLERWCQLESLYKFLGTGIQSFSENLELYSLDSYYCKEMQCNLFFHYMHINDVICCFCCTREKVNIYLNQLDVNRIKEKNMIKNIEIKDLNFSKIDEIDDGDIFERAQVAYEFLKYEYEQENLFTRRISLNGSAPEVTIYDIYANKDRKMIYFASNDYLNLTKHPKTIQSGIDAITKYGSGAGSVPILGGTTDLHVELEKRVAKFKGCEASIAYSSGFGSNCGTLLSLLKKSDLAILDMYVHASIVDGCKNTNVEYFLHNDMNHLEKILKRSQGKFNTILVIVDGVYSMDGDIAPLDQIVDISKKYNGYVMVDEAHATGVIGQNGRGTPEYYNLEGKVDIVAGTFSKGIGAVGGFIASSKELIEMIRYYSRPYMFSTAITPQASASIIAALDIIENEPSLRNQLWKNIEYLRKKLINLGFNLGNSETAIFPIIIGDDEKTKKVCRFLHKKGLYVNLVLFPAVPKELSRIRISVMANHTQAHLDQLIKALEHIGKELEII